MRKDVTMTIRLEPELRSQFMQAAEHEHRPAAHLLRDLMRGYVEQFRARKPRISAAERKRREVSSSASPDSSCSLSRTWRMRGVLSTAKLSWLNS